MLSDDDERGTVENSESKCELMFWPGDRFDPDRPGFVMF